MDEKSLTRWAWTSPTKTAIAKFSHGGSTAGYQTFLSRYPDLKLSIAVMCNGTSRNPAAFERDIFNKIAGWTPTPDELKSLAGVWHSDEADASFTIAVENDKAFFVQRPNTRLQLRPQFKDHFSVGPGQVIWVTRDANGRITKLHVGAGRMRDMPLSALA